jgi:hypothetical protein
MTRYFLILERTAAGFAYQVNVSCAISGDSMSRIGLTRTFTDHTSLEVDLLTRIQTEEAIRAGRSIRTDGTTFLEVTGDQASSLDLLSDG